jgi:hypothetical protein
MSLRFEKKEQLYVMFAQNSLGKPSFPHQRGNAWSSTDPVLLVQVPACCSASCLDEYPQSIGGRVAVVGVYQGRQGRPRFGYRCRSFVVSTGPGCDAAGRGLSPTLEVPPKLALVPTTPTSCDRSFSTRKYQKHTTCLARATLERFQETRSDALTEASHSSSGPSLQVVSIGPHGSLPANLKSFHLGMQPEQTAAKLHAPPCAASANTGSTLRRASYLTLTGAQRPHLHHASSTP